MRKVLVFALVLFCLVLAIPLVSANPISGTQIAHSQLPYIYVATIILSIALADLAIYIIRRKDISKHNFLHILTLSFLISLLALYSRIVTSGSWNLFDSLTIFGYITMIITLLAIADSAIYLMRKRGTRAR